MAANPLTHSDPAMDKFFGIDPDQKAEQFIELIEKKINFALDQEPGVAGAAQDAYGFRTNRVYSLHS